jgi:hypothetical protein
VITSSGAATGVSGSAFSYRVEATNNPTTFTATDLPSGLTLNGSTGEINGILPAARVYLISLGATNAAGTGYKSLTLTVSGNNIFGPPNDMFATPLPLLGSTATSNGTNVNAGVEPNEPAHANLTAQRSVWWRWTAPASGNVTIQTVGSDFDTVLAVYTGTAIGGLGSVIADNDGGGNGTSRVTFAATSGVTYRIAVDGYNGASGQIVLGLQQSSNVAPQNDRFAGRLPISGSIATASAGNVNATAEVGEPAHAGEPATHSVWWTWTAPLSGRVTIDTVGSDFDTVLGVYSGSSLSSLSEVASDDQSGGNNASQVSFPVTAGATYQIAVDGWDGQTGGIQLHLKAESDSTRPANDMFANRASLAGNSAT